MPGLDGIAATVAVREQRPSCRVLVVTTFGRPGYLRRAMEAGASGFMVKDAPAEQLADAIRRVRAGLRVVDPSLAAETLATGESPLTDRERDVLVAAREGGTVADIAVPSRCRRGRCATTCPRPSARPGRVPAPRPSGWRPSRAGSDCGCAGRQWRGDDRMAAAGAGGRARRARADGRHHQPRVPPPGARAGPSGPRRRHRRRGGHLRHRDGHEPGPARAQRGDPRDGRDGPGREPSQRPAVRRRPPRHGRCGAAARRRGPRRPHRPELRLPGAQGDAQGRRGRAALEARAVPRHRPGDGHRGGRPGPGHGQDAHRDRRRAPHPPRGRPGRGPGGGGVGGPARTDRGPALRRHRGPRRGRPPRRRARAVRRPGPRERRHLDRHRRPRDGRKHRVRRCRRRAWLPRPAVAVRPARGGVHRRARRRPSPTCAPSRQ